MCLCDVRFVVKDVFVLEFYVCLSEPDFGPYLKESLFVVIILTRYLFPPRSPSSMYYFLFRELRGHWRIGTKDE